MSISVIQVKTGATAATGPFATQAAATFSATTGNLLAVAVEGGPSGITFSVTDSPSGNTYTALTRKNRSDTNQGIQWFYAKNITGNASLVATAHYSGSGGNFPSIHVYEISGLDTSAPSDVDNGNNGTGTAMASTSFTTAVANEIILAAYGAFGQPTFTAGSGYTGTADASNLMGSEYKIVTSIQTTVTATATRSDSNPWAFVTCSFKIGTSTGRILRNSDLSGLGGSGQQAFNPSLN